MNTITKLKKCAFSLTDDDEIWTSIDVVAQLLRCVSHSLLAHLSASLALQEQLGTLIIHKRIHTCMKPYNCRYCNKKFAQIGNLIVHERIHTGERPYSCNKCEKSFAQLNSLNFHLKSHRKSNWCLSIQSKQFTPY